MWILKIMSFREIGWEKHAKDFAEWESDKDDLSLQAYQGWFKIW